MFPLIVDTCQVSDDYTFRFPESYGDKHVERNCIHTCVSSYNCIYIYTCVTCFCIIAGNDMYTSKQRMNTLFKYKSINDYEQHIVHASTIFSVVTASDMVYLIYLCLKFTVSK